MVIDIFNCKRDFKQKKTFFDFFHFLPFIIYTIYRFSDYLLPSHEKVTLLKSFYNSVDSQVITIRKFDISNFVYDLILFRVQPLIYIIVILVYLYPHFTSPNHKSINERLKWLRILFFGFLIIWIIKYLFFLYGYFFPPFTLTHPVTILFIAIQVFLISQFALTNKTGIPEVFVLKKGISEKELENIAKKARCYINDNNAYLNVNITLHSLSKVLDTNSSYLSKAINNYFNLNFTDFINEFRIEKAKKVIISQKIEFYTLEGIAKESGFSSISTFNRAFLKIEGKTPTQYKKSVNL